MKTILTAILLTLAPALATSAVAQAEPATSTTEKPAPEARGGVGMAVSAGAVVLPDGRRPARALFDVVVCPPCRDMSASIGECGIYRDFGHLVGRR